MLLQWQRYRKSVRSKLIHMSNTERHHSSKSMCRKSSDRAEWERSRFRFQCILKGIVIHILKTLGPCNMVKWLDSCYFDSKRHIFRSISTHLGSSFDRFLLEFQIQLTEQRQQYHEQFNLQ